MERGSFLSLLLGLSLATTNHAQDVQKRIGEIDFICPEGWIFLDSTCYYMVNDKVDREEAEHICESFLSEPLEIEDEVENEELAKWAKASSWESFWIGKEVEDLCKGYWDDHQPPSTAKNGDCVAVQNNGRWKIVSCESRLPFMCKKPACVSGTFDCGNGNCLSNKWKCDGQNDCGNNLDEMDCGDSDKSCSFRYTGASGSINYYNTYSANSDCVWTIVSPPATQLVVNFDTIRLEENVDFLEVLVGAQIVSKASKTERLTGSLDNKVVYSTNNMIILRLLSDATINNFGFRLTWSSAAPDLSSDVQEVTSFQSWTTLTSPFYPSTPPSGFRREYLVSSTEDTIKTIEIEEVELSPDWELLIYNGEGFDDIVVKANKLSDLASPPIYFSTSSKIRIIMKAKDTSKGGDGMKLRVKNGCNVDIEADSGEIVSPGYAMNKYPTSVICTWILRAPATASRNIRLIFQDLNLEDDGNDMIQVFDGSDDTGVSLHSNDGFAGDLSASLPTVNGGSVLFVKFISSLIQDDGKFKFEFSIGCPYIPDGPNMVKSTNNTAYLDQVLVRCEDGYSFKQEENHLKPSMTYNCMKGGMWDEPRYPSCQITYCGPPAAIEFGTLDNSTNAVTFENKVVYRCYEGFQMLGNPEVTCLITGQWSQAPVCLSSVCGGAPGVPNSIQKIITETESSSYGAIVEYTCNEGYEIMGTSRRRCQTDTNWSDAAPSCVKVKCPIPVIAHALVSITSAQEYGDSELLQCAPGYVNTINNQSSISITCGSNGSYPDVTCVDENECDKNPNVCQGDQTCVNTIGSRMCLCKPGYTTLDNGLCQDINECQDNMDGCDQVCSNLAGTYSCSCNAGYELFVNGTSGINIVPGETGDRMGDVYRVGHTCVRKTCARPAELENGDIHSKRTTFMFEDEIMYSCKLGFTLQGNSKRTCQANSQWSGGDPACTAITCQAQTEQGTTRQQALVKGIYPRTSVAFGEQVIIECNNPGGSTTNMTRFCGFDKVSMTYMLQGDGPACPIVDCGPIDEISGLQMPTLTTTEFGVSFTFTCLSGAERKGLSTDNNFVVQCLGNGRWGYGNLTCTAAKCVDPETRGGTEQLKTSYEQGKTVSYSCTRPGFTLNTKANLSCVYSTSTLSASWDGNAPTCKDTTAPVFANCDGTQEISVDKMEAPLQAPGYTVPTALDNSNFVAYSRVNPSGFNPADPVYQDTTVTYAAEDGDGNTALCTYSITVKDRSPGILTCPPNIQYQATETPTLYNITDRLTYSGGQLTSFPQKTVTLADVGEITDYRVTLVTAMGTEKTCAFKVEVVAGGCFESLAPTVTNGQRTIETTAGGLRLTITCAAGSATASGATSRVYTCTGANVWSPSLPLEECIQYTPTDYSYKAQLRLTTQNALDTVNTCRTNFGAIYNAALSSSAATINQLCRRGDETSFYQFSATNAEIFGSLRFRSHDVMVTLGVVNNDGISEKLNACRDLLNAEMATAFAINSAGCVFGVDTGLSTGIASSEAGESCPSGQSLTAVGPNQQCMPCAPGTYLRTSDNSCQDCPDGQYQNQAGQTSCFSCGGANKASLLPRTSAARCVDKCSAGFSSSTGIMPCAPCSENFYWVNSTLCLPCPDQGSTLFVQGAITVSQCRAACGLGQYSLTGYAPCSACPVNFYQDGTAQMVCKECQKTHITTSTGSISSANCTVGDATICSSQCSTEGTNVCSYVNHRLTCNCKPGYTGTQCESQINYCESAPCYNNGVCEPQLGTYKCNCPSATLCSMTAVSTKYNLGITTITSNRGGTEQACKNQCISEPNCVSIVYNLAETFCALYDATQDAAKTEDSASPFNYFTKDCIETFFYTGDNCEVDEDDNCVGNPCHENSVCRDLVGTYECVCPGGVDVVDASCTPRTNLCGFNPCRNGGLCNEWDGVRYQCTCAPQYTGANCEQRIDECDVKPTVCLYDGTCVNPSSSFPCNCPYGSGSRCEVLRDFCATGPCGEGLCINNNVNYTTDCVCEYPFEKNSLGQCSRIDFCASDPCRNLTYTQRCENQLDGYRCVCRTGFEGSLCQHNIDDCISNPCENGKCIDGDNTYTCECDAGWTGSTCNADIQDCVGQCDFTNTERCIEMNQDYECLCRPGFMGKNCTGNINECLSLPCQHGGTCNDGQATFTCDCEPGWTGAMCENPVDVCATNNVNCQNDGVCYNVFTNSFCGCKKGTQGEFCEFSPNICAFMPQCTSQGTCQQSGGTASCNCSPLYGGKSCELIKDHCGSNECMNGGTCSLTDPMGFMCKCLPGFSGSRCEIEINACDTAGCPVDTFCRSQGTTAFCECQPNQILAGDSCKPASSDFDLFLDPNLDSNAVTSETPFILTGDMTIMLWIGYFSGDKSVIISNLNGSHHYFELFPKKIKLSVGKEEMEALMEVGDLETVPDQWDHVAFTWKDSGEYAIYVNGFQVGNGATDFNMTTDESFKMIKFEPSFGGYVSRLTVCRKILDGLVIGQSMQDVNYDACSANTALGWTQYKLTSGSRRYVPSSAGSGKKLCQDGRPKAESCADLPDKKKPEIICRADVTFNTNDRTVEALSVFNKPAFTMGNALKSTLSDALLMKGKYDVVYTTSDDDDNIGICRFKVYVQGGTTCSTNGFVTSESCSVGSIRNFCPSGQAPSVPVPNILRCGARGSYNLYHPLELFVPPTCGVISLQRFTVKTTLRYSLQTFACTDSFTTQTVISLVNNAFVNKISKTWPGLCKESCDTNMVVDAECDGIFVISHVTFSDLPDKLTKNDNSVTLPPDEILKITAKESDDLALQGTALLLKEEVVVTLLPSCNEAVGIDNCISCGPGSFFNTTLSRCVYCPIGSYSATGGACTLCVDTTTLREGSKSITDCIEKCTAGQEYKFGSCIDCPRDFYQEHEGKSFCRPCPLNKRTKVGGTKLASQCFDDCPSGTELQEDGSCQDCAQGYYRTQSLHDNCQRCDGGNTTEGTRTVSASDCVLPDCQKGNYINMERKCMPCPLGTYQTEKWQRHCENCTASYTTENEGADNQTLCKFICPVGMEEMPPNSKTCSKCAKGKYRDSSLIQRFLPCQDCTLGFTTPDTGASNISVDCSIRICNAGQKRDVIDNVCVDCPVGYYQDEDLQVECKKCKDQYTTYGTASNNETDCKFYCPDGEENISGELCQACPRGKYRSNTDALRFAPCQECNALRTTEAEGSTLDTECNQVKCTAGQVLSSNLLSCSDCSKDSYQEESLPNSKTTCMPCGTGKGTKEPKTTNQTKCLPFCAAGEQVNLATGLCEPCPKGTWNDGSEMMRFDQCSPCTDTDYTTFTTGSSSNDACTIRNCEAGYKINLDDVNCDPCGYGKFQPNRAQPDCIDCSTVGPDLNTSTTTASSSDQCTISCPVGKEGKDGSCVLCKEDYYKDTVGYDICQQCTDSLTSDASRVTCNQRFCDKGVGNIESNTCADCLTGFYKETRGNTECMPCPKNFTSAAPKTVLAADCNQLNCEPGFFAFNTDICMPCPRGSYKADVGTQNCTLCDPDKTTENEASKISTDCTIRVCPAGQYRTTGNLCAKCDVGYYQTNPGMISCDKCDPGYTTLLEGSAQSTDCLIVCPAGQYRSDRTACTDCLKGQYQANPGSAFCNNCSAGYTTQDKASQAETDCYKVCPAGQYRPPSDRNACNRCPKGQFQPNEGETTCQQCTPNFSTLQEASTTSDQCLPECSSGRYLKIDSRTCEVCPLGTYQPEAATLVQECTKCQGGKTTANTGSTVSANCNIDDCNPGYKRVEGQGCQACGQGFYQPESSKTSCIECTGGFTTRLNVLTATAADQCIRDCPDGQEYDPIGVTCAPCPIGQIRVKTVLDYCYQCPTGQSTSQAGSNTCIAAPAPTTGLLVRRRWTMRMSFFAQNCDNRDLVEFQIRTAILTLIRRQQVRYPSICVGSCTNVNILFVTRCPLAGRRKKRASSTLEADVVVNDVPNSVANADNTLSRTGGSVLTEALTQTEPVQGNLTQAGVSITGVQAPSSEVTCASGSYKTAAGTCELCAKGQFHNVTSDTCVDCAKDTYQDVTGQTSCKACPGSRKTTTTKSTASSNCLSTCDLDSGYCKNGGVCETVDDNSVRCSCPESYTGATCAVRQSVESNLQWIIIGVCVGIFVLLVVILAIGFCCCRKPDREEKKMRDMQSVAPSTSYTDYMQSPFMSRDYLTQQGYIQYPNPEYDNTAYHDFYRSDRH